jgi:hypothetical protein
MAKRAPHKPLAGFCGADEGQRQRKGQRQGRPLALALAQALALG